MANTTPIFVGEIVGNIVDVADNTLTAVYIGAELVATRVDSLMVVNKDEIDHNVEVYIDNGTIQRSIGVVAVGAQVGSVAGSAPVNLLGSNELIPFTCQDNAANVFLDLPKTWDIYVKVTADSTPVSGLVVAMRGGTY